MLRRASSSAQRSKAASSCCSISCARVRVASHLLAAPLVVLRAAHRLGQRALLGLERFDLHGQLFEFARLLEAELGRGLPWTLTPALSHLGGRGSRSSRPLPQPIAVATHVLAPAAVAERGQHLGHDVVQERAVVAHQQQRARIVLQRLLQQFERLDVEIVGGFVHHQHVRGSREEPRQQQAIALAARQHPYR